MAPPNHRILDEAVNGWKNATSAHGAFQPATRAEMFREAAAAADKGLVLRPLRPVFAPVARWTRLALTAAVPVALAIGLVALSVGPVPVDGTTHVRVQKVGDKVVFEVSNGGVEHRITRSLDPRNFDASGRVEGHEGSFEDPLDSGPDLIFYKID